VLAFGEQLRLDLRMPWDGRNPRDLTYAGLKFRLAPEGTSWPDLDANAAIENRDADPLQLVLQLEDF